MDEQPFQSSNHPSSSVPPPPPLAGMPPGMMALQQSTERPTAATVIGVVLLVFAGIGLLSMLSNISHLTGNPYGHALQIYPRWYLMFGVFVGLVSVTMQLMLGIGLLRMLPWARKAAVIWLICSTVLGITNTVILFKVINLSFFENNISGATSSMMGTTMLAAIIGSIVISLVINGLMIFFLTRPKVIAAFDGKQNAS